MKKVMLLVLTVMLISAFLMASGPSLKVVRLTVINKSGNEVMIKLEGSEIGKQFYYLTIPAGDKYSPSTRTFTVLEDIYTRTTWYGEGDVAQCVGISSTGYLVMDRNNRLTFTPCYSKPERFLGMVYDAASNKMVPSMTTNAGEPSMEKVVYIPYARIVWGDKTENTWGKWTASELIYQGCGWTWIGYKTTTTKVPNLCMWRYKYSWQN